jgi:hypothetical protein
MQTGPKIKLAVDLHRIDKYFPLEHNIERDFDYDMIIDRQSYDDVASLLHEYKISDDQVIREICFILLWIEKETRADNGQDNAPGKFNQMWFELDNLKQYLLNNRITSISFRGEYERNKTSEEFTMMEDINIDRICDGIRSIFRDEFHHDKQKRRSKGLTAWQRRKMARIRNKFLNYFSSIPILDDLSLEDQNQLIDNIADLAGIPGSM